MNWLVVGEGGLVSAADIDETVDAAIEDRVCVELDDGAILMPIFVFEVIAVAESDPGDTFKLLEMVVTVKLDTIFTPVGLLETVD